MATHFKCGQYTLPERLNILIAHINSLVSFLVSPMHVSFAERTVLVGLILAAAVIKTVVYRSRKEHCSGNSSVAFI